MRESGLREVDHLESWIKTHPEVIDPSLMIVATQFSDWESATGLARDRPDVLALSSTGELIIMELKRDGDRNSHLQALTYGALASSFTPKTLAGVHARWLETEKGIKVSTAEAERALADHVDGDWAEDFSKVPRLLIVAEAFPPQVLTTVQWLDAVASDLSIECHEYSLFRDDVGMIVSFTRLFPVAGLEDQVLGPAIREARQTINENRRSPRSAQIIHENQLIQPGARVSLELAGNVVKEVADKVQLWMDEDERRQYVVWVDHPSKPLRWGAADDPETCWTPSALRNAIFERAGVPAPNFSAADAWSVNGISLYNIAKSVREEG